MKYPEVVELIPREMKEKLADKLTNIILSSKNDSVISSDLANTFLYQWQQNLLDSQLGLSTLLETAVSLEQEKTLAVLKDLQLDELAGRI